MPALIFQGRITKVETLEDHSVKLSIVSSLEITSSEELAELFKLRADDVNILLKQGEISQEDAIAIPEPDPEFKTDKSPAQRLRGVIYVLWQQGGSKGDFQSYYTKHMESLVRQFKEKLN